MKVNRIALIISVFVLAVVFWAFVSNNKTLRMGDTPKPVGYTQFLKEIDNKNVSDGSIDKDNFTGHLTKGNQAFTVYLGPENSFLREDLVQRLAKNGVADFKFTPPLISDGLSAILSMVLLPRDGTVLFLDVLRALGAERRQPGHVFWTLPRQTAE